MTELSLTRRMVPRFPFIAEAEVVEMQGGARLTARMSELSAQGGYVDTLNPFPVDTEICLRIRHGGEMCEVPGRVLYTHPGYGMGVLFDDMRADQRAVVARWLTGSATEGDG
jgi:PilZ domain